jgi:hypothetical protein
MLAEIPIWASTGSMHEVDCRGHEVLEQPAADLRFAAAAAQRQDRQDGKRDANSAHRPAG